MRKFLLAVLSVSLTALALSVSGCGGSSDDSGGSTGGVSMGAAKSPSAASAAAASASSVSSGGAGSSHTSADGSNADGTGAVSGAVNAAAVMGPASSTGAADTIVGTVSPAGTIETDLRATTHVTVTFTTSDGGTATRLNVVTSASSLPSGWTFASTPTPCAQVSTGTSCTVTLNYEPTMQATSAKLTLAYSYTNNVGQVELGYVYIPYSPISHNAYVLTTDGMYLCAVASSGDLTSCSRAPTPPYEVGSATMHNGHMYLIGDGGIYICSLGAGGLSNCSQFTGSLTGPQSIAFSASFAYVTNSTGSVSRCSVGSNGTLSNCSPMSIPGTDNAQGLAVYGSTLLVASYSGNQIIECTLDASGNATNCSPAEVTGILQFNEPLDLVLEGSTLYVNQQQQVQIVLQCTFGSDGRLNACSDAGVHNLYTSSGLTFIGNDAYVASYYDNLIDRCTVSPTGKLLNCASATAAVKSLQPPIGIFFF